MRFDEHYEEHTRLESGLPVHLRAIRADDKVQLREGFERLGPRSRYTRFFTGKKALHDTDLVYLTEVDGVHHVAIVAGEEAAEGEGRGLGVARFVRCSDDPEVAEPAIAIVDDAQGQGLGGLLLRRLTEAAVERGIRRFRCLVLADNDAMQALLAELDPHFVKRAGPDGVTQIELNLPVPPVIPQAPSAGMDGAAAEGAALHDRAGSDADAGSGLHLFATAVHRLLNFAARQLITVPFRREPSDTSSPPEPLP